MTEKTMFNLTAQSDTSWRPDLRAPIVMGLAGLLVLQLLLALILSLGSGRGLAPSLPDASLFDFTPAEVKTIRIESGDGSGSVALTRRDAGWIIADLADAPAQGLKVDQLLDEVAALKRPLPMATSEEARERFKVTESSFERRLVIEGERGPLASLLLGDSPGFRRVFASPPDDPGVYELRLALADLSARRDDWIEPGLLRLERDQLARIATADWTLTKSDAGTWSLADSDQALDQETLDALLLKLANLSYRGILGSTDDPAYNQQDPLRVLDIGLTDGSHRGYRISRLKDSQDYVLKDTDRPWYFRVSGYDLGELLDTQANDLVKAEEAPVSSDTSSAAAPPEAATATLVPPAETTPEGPVEPAGSPVAPAAPMAPTEQPAVPVDTPPAPAATTE